MLMKILKKVITSVLLISIIITNQIVFALDMRIDNVQEVKSEKTISAWNIDTNLNQLFYIENGIHIEGWKLSTEANSKIVLSIDGEPIDSKYIKYTYKYDLISIVKGYGTYKENPTPNFDIDIPKDELTIGKHKLKIELKSSNEEILKSVEKEIEITRDIKNVLNIDTKFDEVTFGKNGIEVKGWKLATEADTKLIARIDGNIIKDTTIDMYYIYDLISIVKGYGTYKENPKPNFTINIPTTTISEGEHNLQIQFTTLDGIILKTVESKIKIDKSIKHIINIDTKLDGVTFERTGIQIKGWKLATETDTKLIAKIDGNIIKDTTIDMYYIYDLISIVKGYGTYKENPKPNFTINIPTRSLNSGRHKLNIQFLTYNDIVLEELQYEISIDVSIKHALQIDTKIEEQCWKPNGIQFSGWKIANEPNTRIVTYIGDRKVKNAKIEEYYAYDLISIVKGYGTYKENPTPNFTINIPITEFRDGDKSLKIQMETENGDILETRIYKILESKTRIHIETPYDRTTITNTKQNIIGWVMTTEINAKVRILLDGNYTSQDPIRIERQDVLNAIKDYGDKTINPNPGFELNIDFSKLNIGLHQIAVRVENSNGKILSEQILYVWTRRAITYEEGTYGESGLAKAGDPRGSKLKYYRYGDGPNVFFATFAMHGFEDNWSHDGKELVDIANNFYKELINNHSANYELADKWTIYILPELNPDGVRYGTTSNGAGRTTLYSAAPENKGIDMNRAWKNSGFNPNEKSRNYAGTEPYQAYEAQALRDFLINHKSQYGQTILVDLHGWLQQLVGDREVGMYYAVQFPENHGKSLDRYGDGYLIGWARTALASNGKLAKTSLIELPREVYSHNDVVKQNLSNRYINATLSMLHGII